MSISIINIGVCQSCKKETCAYIDKVTKSNAVFVSEGTVCPTGVLQSNPSQMPNLPFNDKKCIDCGLCVSYCSKQNLDITIENQKVNLEHCNSIGMNILVSNYLNKIFPSRLILTVTRLLHLTDMLRLEERRRHLLR